MSSIASIGRVISAAVVSLSAILLPCTGIADACQCWRPKPYSCDTACIAGAFVSCSLGYESVGASGQVVCSAKVEKQVRQRFESGTSGPCGLPPPGWIEACGAAPGNCCYRRSGDDPEPYSGSLQFSVPNSDSFTPC